jgi:hypothetical protein
MQSHKVIDLRHKKTNVVDRIVELYMGDTLTGFLTPTSDTTNEGSKGKLDLILNPGWEHFSFYCNELCGVIINKELFDNLNKYSHSEDIERIEIKPKPEEKK